MPQYIIRNGNAYNLYSSIVDAPMFVSALTREQLFQWYKEEYGTHGMRDLPERMKRVDAKGCSSRLHASLKEFLVCNRAGKDEATLSFDEFVRQFLTLPDPDTAEQ